MANAFDVLRDCCLSRNVDIDPGLRWNHRVLEFRCVLVDFFLQSLRLSDPLSLTFALLPFDKIVDRNVRHLTGLILDHRPVFVVMADELDDLSVLCVLEKGGHKKEGTGEGALILGNN